MPVLSRFYGIVIRMYFQQAEHNPPHIHALYGEDVAEIDIQTGKILEGSLPPKAISMVQEWVELNKNDLLKIWETQEFKSLSPLE
jgi:TRAP-type mannitol/chloroaromatic compound transport system permease large subunit